MGMSGGPATSARYDFVEERLFSVPPGGLPDAMTADGHGVAFVALDEGGVQALWDGAGGEPFDELMHLRDKTAAIFSSDDGEHLAFVGGRAGQIFVARDGSEGPPFEAFTRSVPPVFSRDGGHLAYGALSDGECRLVLDGRNVNTLPVAPFQAVFSPAGDRFAFVETRLYGGDQPELRIVLDGVPGSWFFGMRNATGAMQFSPDGKRFASYRIDEQGRCQWIVDGSPGRLGNEVREVGLAQLRGIGIIEEPLMAVFSPDSRRFAYAADVHEKGVAVIEDDVVGPRFKGVGMPLFSPDSRHLVYVAETFAGKLVMVLDGEPGPEWEGSRCGDLAFSRDSKHVAVAYVRDEGRLLWNHHSIGCVVDGRVVAEARGDDAPAGPILSPDGEHVAWWYWHDDILQMMLDDTPYGGEHIAFSVPVFSSTGHFVYAAIVAPGGRVTIRFDGRLGPLADGICAPMGVIAIYGPPHTGEANAPFAVSPDGEHVAWAGQFGEESLPVLDDAVGPSFDVIMDSTFDARGTATWWAQRGDVVFRVTAQPMAG